MIQGLKVAIAAGGTAGHINPALAVAEELAERGAELSFVGQPTRLEAKLVPDAGFSFVPIEVSGFDRKRPWSIIPALMRMRAAERELTRHFDKRGWPDIAIGFGAYVELPLLRLCAARHIPYILHEQNSVPGLANKTMAKNAELVAISFPQAEAAFKGKTGPRTHVVFTGNPVRKSITGASRHEGRAAFGLGDDETMLLVFGGSLGAKHINEAVSSLKEQLLSRPELRIVHSTGGDHIDAVRDMLKLTEQEAARWQLLPYIDNMGEALAAADLVLSRAGASSIAEIAATAVPALLVPYPEATENHQATNASLLVDAGAAELVDDGALDAPVFAEKLLALIDDAGKRAQMRDAARGLGASGAASALADRVESIAGLK